MMNYKKLLFGLLGAFVIMGMTCQKTNKGAWMKVESNSGVDAQVFMPTGFNKGKKKFPLVLFLHGAGERGDDNESQLIHIAPLLSSDSIQQKFPSILVFPQCPENGYWAPIERTETQWLVGSDEKPTPSMASVMTLLKKYLNHPNVDIDRVYLAGLSMGGFGAFDILSRMPNTFAAAIPICGGADTTKMDLYKHVPLWNFHGAIDPVVPVELSQTSISKFIEVGGKPRYTEYPDGGHDVWTQAFDEPELLPWLFSQSK